MTVLALANAAAHAAFNLLARMLCKVKSAFVRVARLHAQARIHKARREAEKYRDRYRTNTKTDDDLPVII